MYKILYSSFCTPFDSIVTCEFLHDHLRNLKYFISFHFTFFISDSSIKLEFKYDSFIKYLNFIKYTKCLYGVPVYFLFK